MTDRAHGGNKRVLYDFSVNLNPIISEKFLGKILSSLSSYAMKYPEERAESLIYDVANYYGIREEYIVAGNGSIELLYYLPRVININRIVTLEPTFCEYRYISEIYNLHRLPFYAEYYCTEGKRGVFKWDIKSLKDSLGPSDLVIICNPNNPTGNLFSRKDILEILDTKAFVLIDEAFMDFSERNESLIKDINLNRRLFILKSFTKIFSIAGLRVGFLIGDDEIIKSLKKILPLWNVNGIAIEVTKRFLKEKRLIEDTKSFIKKEKDFITKNLSRLPVNIFESYGNFLLIRIERALDFIKEVENKGISVRTNAGFLGLDETFIRVAIRGRKENKILVEAFKAFFED